MIKYSQPILILIILLTSMSLYNQTIEVENKAINDTKTLLDIYSYRIENIVNGTIRVADILEELIVLQNGDVPLNEIERLSEVLFDDEIHINISYAPNGVIAYAYPPEGNEAAIGHNLLEDPVTQFDSKKALESGLPTLSKPYLLRQGIVAAVVRDPVFIVKDGKEEFWGFIAVAMRSSTGILIHSGIDSIERFNYQYRLEYLYNDSPVEILQSKKFDNTQNYFSDSFETKYGTWVLSLYYETDVSEKFKRAIAISLFYISLGYILLYSSYKFKNITAKQNKKR